MRSLWARPNSRSRVLSSSRREVDANSPGYLRRKATPGALLLAVEIHNLSLYEYGKDVLELCLGHAQIWGSRRTIPDALPRRSRLKGETEMSRKLPGVLPMAILLAAVSAAPALAKSRSHHVVQPVRHVVASPCAYGSDAYDSYAMQPGHGDGRSSREAPALPWIQDPDSPRG
jgi:hypothetical protein